jgi:hypothetical protein
MAASAAPASDAHMHGSSWAGASAVSLSDVALTCRETTADAGRPAAPAAVPAECAEQGVEATAAAAPTSLRARFARLPPRVQEDILRKLDELSAMEDEMRGVRDAELQGGPRVSVCLLSALWFRVTVVEWTAAVTVPRVYCQVEGIPGL